MYFLSKKQLLTGVALLLAIVWLIRHALTPAVDVIHPVKGPAVQAVYATGTVEATVMMPIAPRSATRLMELKADEGVTVTKGQVLAQLEDDDLQNTIIEMQAREKFAHDDYERKLALTKHNTVSQSTADQAKADWDAAQAAVARAQAQSNFMKLLAPADGLIIKRDGEVGQMIAANQPVFWLSCCAPLRISTEVDEEDVALVKPGQAVLIRADAFPGQVFHGKVQSITPKGDPVARSYRVRVEFTEKTPLQIGMTAETNIMISEHKDALLVPNGVVKNNKVWLVKDGSLAEQVVKIGAKGLDQTEIVTGITATDEVVLKPTATLKAGDHVRTKLIEQEK